MYVVACPGLPWAHCCPGAEHFCFGQSLEIAWLHVQKFWPLSSASFRQVFSPEYPRTRIPQNLPESPISVSKIVPKIPKKTNSNILIIPRVSSRIITYLYAYKQRSSEDSMIRNAPSTASLLALAHLVPQWPCIGTEQPIKKKNTRNSQTLSDYLYSTKQTCTDQITSKNHEYPGFSVGWQARNPKLHGNRPIEVLLLLQRTLPVPEHRSYKKKQTKDSHWFSIKSCFFCLNMPKSSYIYLQFNKCHCYLLLSSTFPIL